MPAGWFADGDGMRHGYVDEGTPLVSLEGPAVVQSVLPRGYDTHSLSPKLAGALRSPRLQLLEKVYVSLDVAGGDWAATRTVPVNAFLSGSPEFLESPASSWKGVSSSRNVNRDDWATWFELATASLNSTFPGIEPNLRKKKFDQRADMEAFNGWFSLTGIVAHDKPEAPKDALHHWQELFAQPAPKSAAAAWSGIGKWLAGAVERWCRSVRVSRFVQRRRLD